MGYAQRLSRNDNKGTLGMPEVPDASAEARSKAEELAGMLRQCRQGRVTVYTGAGVSTPCGIPDFRGPDGIWTREAQGRDIHMAGGTPMATAVPSLCHQVIRALAEDGRVGLVVSQNVDGLHLRSGLDPGILAELHGNCFLEVCTGCEWRHFRDFEAETVGEVLTGNRCSRCKAPLRDTVLDWDGVLPDGELKRTERQTRWADVVLTLGTSLQIQPAADIPERVTHKRRRKRRFYEEEVEDEETEEERVERAAREADEARDMVPGKLAIVNLQATPKDRKASLVIRAKCDAVMALVARRLALRVPEFRRKDAIGVSVTVRDGSWSVDVWNAGDRRRPLPWLKWAEVVRGESRTALPVRGPVPWGTEDEVDHDAGRQPPQQQHEFRVELTLREPRLPPGARHKGGAFVSVVALTQPLVLPSRSPPPASNTESNTDTVHEVETLHVVYDLDEHLYAWA